MKKLCIALGSTLVALLALEVGTRAWLGLRGEAYSSGATRAELARLVDPARTFVPRGADEPDGPRRPVLHPFTGSEWAHDTGGVLAAFHRGFGPDEYTVVIIGGSVAAAFALAQGTKLEQRLADDPRLAGKRVRVLNYAHAAYKQPQMVMRMAFLFSLGHQPDAVLAIDGFNEVASALENHKVGSHPIYPSGPVWHVFVRDLRVADGQNLARAAELLNLRREAERKSRRALSLGLHRSSILGRWVLADLRRLRSERAAVQGGVLWGRQRAGEAAGERPPGTDRQLNGPDYDPDPQAVLATGARSWFESSLSIHSMCEARGVRYLHVLQPTLHDVGAKPISPEERELGPIPEGWLEGARDGYPLLRARAADLEARGVRFHDASRLFEQRPEPLYFDHCHLNPRGNDLLAEDILAALLGGPL